MTWTAALTPFADMTSEEFGAFYLGTKPRPAAIQAFESQTMIKNGKLENLSEQDLVDCVKNTPVNGSACCDGCQGGLMDAGFHYMVDKQGGKDATEDSYP